MSANSSASPTTKSAFTVVRTPRTPLAWKNLVHDWRRLVLSASGVAFAAVLIFTQNGFRNALLDSPVQLIDMVDASLIAISKARYMLPVNQRFDRDLLRRIQTDPDVVDVRPMYIERLMARVRVKDHPSRPIRVIAVPTDSDAQDQPWLDIDGLAEQRYRLRRPGTALVDLKSREEFAFEFDGDQQPRSQVVELADQRINLVGSVTIGTDFANEGTLLISDESFADYFSLRNSGRPLETVDLGLIRLREGSDA
ncbi:MAG: ABC transporter, partial [Planctomycetota bacterium]